MWSYGLLFFFFKQKTAYDMRISDWSSDVCSSDLEVARGDISRLRAAGWVAPEPFTVKARDGKTDLYGLMFKPTNFDPTKQYPIVNYIYPGPQTGSVRSRSFLASHEIGRAHV